MTTRLLTRKPFEYVYMFVNPMRKDRKSIAKVANPLDSIFVFLDIPVDLDSGGKGISFPPPFFPTCIFPALT